MEKVRQLHEQLESGFENHRVAVALLAGIQAVTIWAGAEAIADHHDAPVPVTHTHHNHAHKHHHHHKKANEPQTLVTPTPTITPTTIPKVTHAETTSHKVLQAPKEKKSSLAHTISKLHKPEKPHIIKDLEGALANIFGIDISWPNEDTILNRIPKLYLGYGIIGITGGENFTTNHLMKKQAEYFTPNRRTLYVVPDFDGKEKAMERDPRIKEMCKKLTRACVARQYGFDAGVFNVDNAANSGIYVARQAVDIESQKYRPWTKDLHANAVSIQAVMDGEVYEALRLGLTKPTFELYSTPIMFRNIAGGWMPGLPVWLATGHRPNMSFAKARCADDGYQNYGSFGGGAIKEVQSGLWRKVGPHGKFQWLDVNVSCPKPYK